MSTLVTERYTDRYERRQGTDQGLTQLVSGRIFDLTAPAGTDEPTLFAALATQMGVIQHVSVHPGNPYLRCRDIDIRQVAPIRWIGTAEYRGLTYSNGEENNPLNIPPTYEWDTVDSEEPIDEDIDGKPICTVLGEPFDPPLSITISDLLLKITKNVPYFDASLITTYTKRKAVNANMVLGQPPGTVRINKLKATSVYDPYTPYYRAYMELQFRRGAPETTDERAFWRRVRAQGYYVLLPKEVTFGDEDLIVHATKDGQPVSRPVLHHKDDGIQIYAEPGTWPEADWYEFQVHPSMDFTPLNFFS